MKNTQKKLKAKHFRYLSKEYIDNPMCYLIHFFKTETHINDWLTDINKLINAATNEKMGRPHSSFGYDTKKLIEQVEIAYVIFKKDAIEKQKKPLDFFKCVGDYYNYAAGDFAINDCRSLTDGISRFFSYRSLGEWYETLDAIWINMIDQNGEFLNNEGDNIIAVRELLQRLVISLHSLYENNIRAGQLAFSKDESDNNEIQDKQIKHQTDIADIKENQSGTTTENKLFLQKKQIVLPTWLATQPFSISALKDFFDRDDLSGWRKDIRYWYRTTITENEFWSAGNKNNEFSSSHLLFVYSCIYSLLEMLYNTSEAACPLLVNIEDSVSILNECQSISIEHDNDNIILYYVCNEELNSPLSSLLVTVRTFGKLEWNEILYEWINYGLDRNKYTGTYADYSAKIYQTLIKIVELSYLTAFSDEIKSG